MAKSTNTSSKFQHPNELILELAEGNTFLMTKALEELVEIYRHTSTDDPAVREETIEAINHLGEFLNKVNADISYHIDKELRKYGY